MSIYRGAGGSGDATNDATVSQVQTYASQAATSATNAASSATAAAASASGASTSATLATAAKNDSQAIATTVAGYVAGALASETAADVSATEAAASAAAAAISEGGASGSASDALDSANTATTQATAASTSATDSANSAASALAIYGDTTAMNTAVTNAGNSATAAATSATNAATSASNASSSASAASSSASAASTSASAAATSAGNAATSASNASSSASAASSSASSASTSASTATTQASNAATSATSASNSASTATTQAGIATTGGTTATTQAGIATTQAGIATTGATTATTQAGIATTQASNASTSATNASSSETNSLANRNAAATSATAASTSASAAATSATSSATSASAAATSAAAASAVALGNEPVRHSVRPSLLLDFANTKQLDPRITFTRASTATFYDGKTTAKAEENLFTYSQQISLWGINAALTLTGNATSAPDGTTTATLAVPTNASQAGRRLFSNTVTMIASTSSFSLYVKASGYTKMAVREGLGGYYAAFDLASSGSVLDSLSCTPSIASVGNGWFRITILATATAGGNIFSIFPLDNAYTTGNPTVYTFTGDGTSGVFLWGAQVEQRSSVTAYTPTTTAAITNYIPALQTAASGVARFDHNPTTGESLGLLIEEQRVNLATYSQAISTSNGYITDGISTLVANQLIAPDGTLTASHHQAGANRYWYKVVTGLTASTAYTFSLYVKLGTGGDNTVTISQSNGGSTFNLATGTVTSGSGTIQAVGNGWYRCTSGAITTTGTTTSCTFVMNAVVTAGQGHFVWGAQLEAGAFATSYIPTVASQVTRSPDAASMTGTNFSSWYRQDEGTIYCRANNNNGNGGSYQYYINDGTASNYIRLGNNASTISAQMAANGTNNVNIAVASGVANNYDSYTAFAYKTNDCATSNNGGTVVNDTVNTIPVVNQIAIGVNLNLLSAQNNNPIKKFAYYPKRLTNAELQGLTTI